MTLAHQQDIESWWSSDLAMPPDLHPRPGEVQVLAQAMYAGVQFFHRDDWLVIAAPPHRADGIAARVRHLPIGEIFSVAFVERLLSPDVGMILGPAHVSYADAATFCPSPTNGCRPLTADEAADCDALAAALSTTELEQSGFEAHKQPAFGAFTNGVLCAVASYEIWEPRIAPITVATHPAHRRGGHGRAVVSALADHALGQGLVLQYRALAANVNSLALGRSLGFQHYCSTIYARPAEPTATQ
jgi:GNAT superfamily N-acetyltransferase